MTRNFAAALLSLCLAAPGAMAATMTFDEATQVGDFDGTFSPIAADGVIPFGFDHVIARPTAQNDIDVFSFQSLATGAQSITFDLSLVNPNAGPSDNAGVNVVYKEGLFDFSFDGTQQQVSLFPVPNPGGPTSQQITVNLDDTFAGVFSVAFQWTNGTNIQAAVTAPGNMAPIPLPAPGLLLLSAAGLLLVPMRRRKGRSA